MNVIDGVHQTNPTTHGDERGLFSEIYRREWFPNAREMIQSNRVFRSIGSIAGLHYHMHQADYWYCVSGFARVVLHDLRIGSPTERVTHSFDFDSGAGVYIPPGVAHGFAALAQVTITYLVDNYYNENDELGVAWDDPEIAGEWGLLDPVLSTRDALNPERSQLTIWPTWPMRT